MFLQIFLCSLFAPVCVGGPVFPCRELCVSVRDACSPIMSAFGFFWPQMLECVRFPQEEQQMCINTNSSTTMDVTPTCPQCDPSHALELMRASEFALKSRVRETLVDAGDTRVFLQKKKKLLRAGDLSSGETRSLELLLIGGAGCLCPPLDQSRQVYLIMGRRVSGRHLLTGIHRWDRSGHFRNLLKQLKSQK